MNYAYVRMNDGIDKNDDTYGSLRSKCINDAIKSLEPEYETRDNKLRLMSKKRAIKALRDEWKKRY